MNPLSLGKSLRSCSVAFHSVRQYHLADIIIERAVVQWPHNSNLEAVLTKVVLLNSLYHTNVLDVWKIAQHICGQNVDSKIQKGDLTVVDDIRLGHGIRNKKERNLYSFAAKYLNWHRPTEFPIYDNLVARLLTELNREYGFHQPFVRSGLKNYQLLKSVLDGLTSWAGLEDLRYKRIDEALWVYAKQRYDKLPDEISTKVGLPVK